MGVANSWSCENARTAANNARTQKGKSGGWLVRMQLLLSFRNSGFSVDTSPTVWPQDTQGLEACLAEASAKAEGFVGIYFDAP